LRQGDHSCSSIARLCRCARCEREPHRLQQGASFVLDALMVVPEGYLFCRFRKAKWI